MKPFARIPGPSDDFEDEAQRRAIDVAVDKRRRATRRANLGTFTGYRIGLDIGNGNIGWCILFEDGRCLRFLTAEDIADHNRALPKAATRTQIPGLADFVPVGVHKFDARVPETQKSLSKVRAEARASRRLLDARQRRRLHVRRALQDAGLLPKEGEDEAGHVRMKSDVLRAKLLKPDFQVHPHDLGRALVNTLKRRGYMKPIGRAGADEGSGFAAGAEERYRDALKRFECETIGAFLERCAQDAKRDKVPFRKRHRSLEWQRKNRRRPPQFGDETPSYEVFQSLSPTFSLIREECRLLRERSGVSIEDDAWARIEVAAEFRRPLKSKTPGRCRHFPARYRCVAALPSFQRFRILENVSNLRDESGQPLDSASFKKARRLLETSEKISLAGLSQELGKRLRLDRGDAAGARHLVGARTDVVLGNAFGEAWLGLSVECRDDWTMRFLRRHWPPTDGGGIREWTAGDEEALERDAGRVFEPGALERTDGPEIWNAFEDRFTAMSVEAARLLAGCYARRLSHEEQQEELREAGAPKPEPELPLYEGLPYYGEVMPDVTVPAEGFAPEERTVAEEGQYGRAANPDVHVVMNRLRKVVNAIIDMMGGILPTTCVVEMARSTFSEVQADSYRKTAKARQDLRERIVAEIMNVSDVKRVPKGPALDRLVDRWKAAVRQGWRDYDGCEISRSALVDGTEYQLDHVRPAAFGEGRESNLFVSRFNRRKGRRLPWKAFGEDPEFRPALLAFAQFGVTRQIKRMEEAMRNPPKQRRRRERLEAALERAIRERDRLAEFGTPRPDVLSALERPPTVSASDEGNARTRGTPPFRPGDQAALFRRFHPDYASGEDRPAARDIANIGWSTKLARRYLRHLGAESEPIKAWAVHALRCMFGIDKDRSDHRNHAVDAFLVAHFDKHVLKPAFDRIRHEYAYEELYETRALEDSLNRISGGAALFNDFKRNLDRLERILPTIYTAHRANNTWNPESKPGGSFGSFGKKNIFSFKPDIKKRKDLTDFFRREGIVADTKPVLTRKEILALYREMNRSNPKERRIAKKLDGTIEVSHRKDERRKIESGKMPTASSLSRQEGAFINIDSKFAIVGADKPDQRRVVSIADFSRMNADERAAVFAAGQPLFRSGDTVVEEGEEGGAFLVTGLKGDSRLIAYPINEVKQTRKLITPDRRMIRKFSSDVLGRRLHKLGKSSRGLKQVPYPLRDRQSRR